ncbi:hypothetical protein Pcinc_005712 [Petrolisthes cinctipes]|uniref:Uncharacterized protein n=1 Tax=Petrolisthes cinctipes TaxID=88211 RepID=A0AAE1KYT0_PETCI|nr:hypothetical protein Pcinc_005712 [Petrolisthes cinctipes]
MGGDQADVESYWAQNLQRKIAISFGDKIKIKLAGQRRGNSFLNSVVPEDEAFARLHCDAEEHLHNDKLRWAALHLRSQIMKLPKSRTPNPATVQNLKESTPDIPTQLDLFFRSLLGGLTPKFRGAQKDGFDRKVTTMASDAIFNITGGTVKPWKHTALGLEMASLTGYKLTLQILNSTEEMNIDEKKIQLKSLDLYWFGRLQDGNTPLHSGFISMYVKDPLPIQIICYVDPISRSPTNNDVVRETMVRTMSIAKETGQSYGIVTYDLAVAIKAYSIQEIERPLFDKLLVQSYPRTSGKRS